MLLVYACRRPDQHEQAHPEGAVSVPMYRLIDMGKADFAKVSSGVMGLPCGVQECCVFCGVV